MQEILVLKSTDISADLLRRNTDGSWPEQPIALGADDELVLESIGYRGRLADAYRTTRLRRPAA